MKSSAARFLRDDSGVSAVEYTLIAACGVVAVLAMIGAFSDALDGWAESLGGRLTIE